MKKKQIQVNAPRCSWGRRIGTVVGLVGLFATMQVQAQFSGDFAPSKWAFTVLAAPGSPPVPGTYEWLNPVGDTATGLLMKGSTTPGLSDIEMGMTYGGSGATLDVAWQLVNNGNNGNPSAFLMVNSTVYPLVNAGSMTVLVPSSAQVAFELESDVNTVPGTVPGGKVPATLTVSIRESTVPDSSLGGLALLPMLGFLAFHAYKQNRREVTFSTVGRR